MRESWWLLVVAAFAWLAMVLFTYTRNDPAWSTSGIGAPIANKGGVAGAWLSDLLFYLFGVSAWWWVAAGVVLVVAGYRRIGQKARARFDGRLGLNVGSSSALALEAYATSRSSASASPATVSSSSATCWVAQLRDFWDSTVQRCS